MCLKEILEGLTLKTQCFSLNGRIMNNILFSVVLYGPTFLVLSTYYFVVRRGYKILPLNRKLNFKLI